MKLGIIIAYFRTLSEKKILVIYTGCSTLSKLLRAPTCIIEISNIEYFLSFLLFSDFACTGKHPVYLYWNYYLRKHIYQRYCRCIPCNSSVIALGSTITLSVHYNTDSCFSYRTLKQTKNIMNT